MRTLRLSWIAATALGLVAMLGGTTTPAHADEDGSIQAGVGWWWQDNAEAKLREFRDLPRELFVETFDYRRFGESGAVSVYGENFALQDGYYGAALRKGVRWQLKGSYRYTPHLYSMIARTPYTELEPGVFLLPDNIQNQNQQTPSQYRANMERFLATAGHTDLHLQTDVVDVDLRARPVAGWRFDAKAERRSRAGRKAYGAAFGFNNAVELVEPIDQKTVQGEVAARYRNEKLAFQATFGGSSFDNATGSLYWDNPKRLTDTTYSGAYSNGDASKAGQLDFYPNNHLLRGGLQFSAKLPSKTFFNASAIISQGKQDDDFLPHTVNTRILSTVPGASRDSFPQQSLDASYTRTVLDGKLRTRMLTGVVGTLRAHYQDYDNQTDELSFNGYVRLDQVWQAGVIHTHPVSNKQQIYGLDVDWSPLRSVGLRGTAEYRLRDRTYREIEKDDETILGAEARFRPVEDLLFEANYRHGNRIADDLILEDYEDASGALIEQPGLRRYDAASRQQDLAGADVTWTATQQVDLSVHYDYLKNDYVDSPYGLQYEEINGVVGQANVELNQRVSVHGGYGVNRRVTNQASIQGNPPIPNDATGVPWWALIEDRNDFAFAGADFGLVPSKLSLLGDYTYSRDQTQYDLDNTVGSAIDLPDTYYRRHEVQLDLVYHVTRSIDLTGRYGFDTFRVKDFAGEDIDLAGITGTAMTAIYLGDSIQGYDAHRFAVLASHRF